MCITFNQTEFVARLKECLKFLGRPQLHRHNDGPLGHGEDTRRQRASFNNEVSSHNDAVRNLHGQLADALEKILHEDKDIYAVAELLIAKLTNLVGRDNISQCRMLDAQGRTWNINWHEVDKYTENYGWEKTRKDAYFQNIYLPIWYDHHYIDHTPRNYRHY